MRKPVKIGRISLALLFILMMALLTGCGQEMMVFDPKGPIAQDQRDLIVISTVLCLIVLVPVLAMTAVIVWRYRDAKGNKAAYKPNWSHSTKLEMIWWGIPIVIILILAGVTVKYTYALEPSKPIESDQKPIVVQATSLDWKWLFTYPEQGIATVNYLQIPKGVPIKFELTSDAPMNSFWIPQLGGQMYTMSGMAMTLYLQADEAGKYFGTAANFSGEHFNDMKFDVHATSREEFDKWAAGIKKSASPLTQAGYDALAKPGRSGEQFFSSFPDNLFYNIVTKYAVGGSHGAHGGHGAVPGGSGNESGGKPSAAVSGSNKMEDVTAGQGHGAHGTAGGSGHGAHSASGK
ncbi:ubiquinol oxidase subunit II [Paenibacillus ehimensis]|uniref:Quinol oxidase subunit 2 n=1 Tax=Paenibacillus ehimensis TaxID=79264 RepID=A0ABT8V5W8_9BACL|nr:ubiquinol oxidase subunit II [Paenibacillus ehimensis]MDO3675877.1 ubiquinol oxidase subunit II [Paenibacillus ehimensis]MEC0208499.1 ubiquinol oxidase subunit II [Paenibacillus ehimensis]